LDRRANTSDGSGRASPTVVTTRQDDDLIADTEQSSGILGTSPVRTATWPAAATAAKETPAKEDSAIQASANGTSAAGENGTGRGPALADVPGLPADGIGATRDSFAFNRPVAAPVSPADDGRTLAETGTSAPGTARVPAENEPAATESAAAETGTGWPAKSAEVQASGGPEPSAVSAAAFVSDPPQPTPSSSVRNFLRSGASAKTSSPPPTPAVSVNPPKAQTVPGGAPVPGARAKSKGSAKRSARQAHLTIARVEPWSVMKFSFVVSLIAFVILFVAVSVIYGTLSALGVFTSLQHVVQSVTSSQDSSGVNAAKWFTESRVLSYTALLGALNIVLITAMATIGAVVYNLTSRLIGGVEVTLRETE
jgi:Transmembrane domain of unknown function (DUF3566)